MKTDKKCFNQKSFHDDGRIFIEELFTQIDEHNKEFIGLLLLLERATSKVEID